MGSGFTLLNPQRGGVGWDFRRVQPPGGQYITADEGLSISWWSSINPTAFEVRGRLLRPDGNIAQIRTIVASNSGNNRQLQQQYELEGPGFLLDLAVFPASGVITTRGQVFVSVQLARGPNVGPFGTRALIQGYLENLIALQYPGSPIQGFLDGPGFLRFIAGTQPPAGGSVRETCPTGARWRLVSFLVGLSTDGTGGNRQITFDLNTANDTNTIFQDTNAFGQAGSTVVLYTWHPIRGTAIQGTSESHEGIFQPVYMKAGDSIVLVRSQPGPADQFGTPAYEVEEWLQP